MKILIILFSLLSVQSVLASSVLIQSGKYNAQAKAIELNVVYGGGCQQHKFHLDINMCQETYPLHCPNIQLVDETTTDYCRAIVHKTIQIGLREARLDEPYFSNASLIIHSGSSSVKITLPNYNEAMSAGGLTAE